MHPCLLNEGHACYKHLNGFFVLQTCACYLSLTSDQLTCVTLITLLHIQMFNHIEFLSLYIHHDCVSSIVLSSKLCHNMSYYQKAFHPVKGTVALKQFYQNISTCPHCDPLEDGPGSTEDNTCRCKHVLSLDTITQCVVETSTEALEAEAEE